MKKRTYSDGYRDVTVNMPIMFIEMGEEEAKREGTTLKTKMFSLIMTWITDRRFPGLARKPRTKRARKRSP